MLKRGVKQLIDNSRFQFSCSRGRKDSFVKSFNKQPLANGGWILSNITAYSSRPKIKKYDFNKTKIVLTTDN